MGLPVIIINTPFPGLANFISKISCPCTLFFDEFEKNFNTKEKDDIDLLSIMDGVYNNSHRRVFLLTTNKLHINDNLLSRPSRIRYRKSFGNLSESIVMEYLNDYLEDKSYTHEILKFIDTLSLSTIDILKNIVEEINIHKTPLSEFKNFLNVEHATYSYCTKAYCFKDSDNVSVDTFKKILSKTGTVKKYSSGTEEKLEPFDLDTYDQRINTSTPINLLHVGDDLRGYGKIFYPIDTENIIGSEDEYGNKWYFKVLNIDYAPSLYKGGLTC